jgi:trimethylamine--corrinoid protein Co-methyltransferase
MAPLAILTPEDILAIHHATLRILSEVGILLQDEEARTLLFDHGAREVNGRICLPPDLVEGCIARCPRRVTVQGRGGRVELGAGEMHVHNLGGARDVLDKPGGDPRPAIARDLAESARLLDALENATTITPLYTPSDVPPSAMAVVMYSQTIRHTLKPVSAPGVQTAAEVRHLVEMARIVLGEAASIPISISPISPLNFLAELAPSIIEIARQGMPLAPLPCPQAGISAPLSLAGALAQQNAEVLATITLAQLVRPGLPILYCGRLAVIDMRTALPIWGNPEIALVSAATVQIGHSYGLPVNVYGLCGSGHAIDIQTGYERALNAVVPALAGADELSGIGEMTSGTISSNVQMVIDNEIIGMVRRICRGFAVNEDSLAVEVIAQVMDSSMHNFLSMPHTVKYLRGGEQWRGRLAIQGIGWEQWRDSGRPTVVEQAEAEVRRILSGHEVEPLPDDQARALDEIVQAVSGK